MLLALWGGGWGASAERELSADRQMLAAIQSPLDREMGSGGSGGRSGRSLGADVLSTSLMPHASLAAVS